MARAPQRTGATPKGIAVKFSEAIEFLRRRLAIGSEEWQRILAAEGETSTAIADGLVRSMMEELAAAVLEAIEEGRTFDEFRGDYTRITSQYEYLPAGDAGWHAQLVFRLHTGMAYAAGRWEQAQRLEAARPGTIFGRYVTAGDHRVRPSHREMHGVVLPIGHDWWRTHWPPNGFNCRCHVMIVTRRDLARYGWTVTADSDPRLLAEPDQGFAFNPGLVGERLRKAAPPGTALSLNSGFDPNQPRVPRGNPTGGQWTDDPAYGGDGKPGTRKSRGEEQKELFPGEELGTPTPERIDPALFGEPGEEALAAAREIGLFHDTEGATRTALALLAGIPEEEMASLKVRWLVDEPGGLTFSAFSDGARIERTFRLGDDGIPEVSHDYYFLDARYQGGGHARRMLREAVELYRQAGIGRIRLHANLDVGGYAWAKYGFVPDDAEALRGAVAGRLRKLELEGAHLPLHIEEAWRVLEDDGFAYRLAHGPLGKELLLHTDWYGTLDLDDPEAVERLKEAIG